MSELLKESLSALMDDEANELELQRLLRESADPGLRETWSRYHRVSSIMREGRDSHSWQLDVSSAVSQAIANDKSAPMLAENGRWARVLRPAASFAVAASVFASVLVGGQLYGLVGAPSDSAASLAGRASPVGLVNTMGGAAVNVNYGSRDMKSERIRHQAAYNQLARQRLQQYILPHTEHASLNSPQGMMPYARVAAERSLEQ